MKVFDFNISKGIYSFAFNDLNTDFHSHPIVEIISADEGTFDLISNTRKMEKLKFAIIDSNVNHKVQSANCCLSILMVESNNQELVFLLKTLGIVLTDGCYTESQKKSNAYVFNKITEEANLFKFKKSKEKRVDKCISIMENERIAYSELVQV